MSALQLWAVGQIVEWRLAELKASRSGDLAASASARESWERLAVSAGPEVYQRAEEAYQRAVPFYLDTPQRAAVEVLA